MIQSVKTIMNIENQSEINCFLAVIQSKGEAIKYVENPSDNLIKLSLRLNGHNIRFIPEEKKTADVCLLAAIHGAPRNLINEVTPDIEAFYNYKEILSESRGYSNITMVNGEYIGCTNYQLAFIDIPEYYQYFVDLNYKIREFSMINYAFIKDGKMFSMANCSDSIKNELIPKKSKISEGMLINDNGEVNEAVIKNIIKNSPKDLFTVLPKDKIKKPYIYKAILEGLDLSQHPEAFDYIDLTTACKAYATRVKQYHRYLYSSVSKHTLSKTETDTFKFILKTYKDKEEKIDANIVDTISLCLCSAENIGEIFGFMEKEEIIPIRDKVKELYAVDKAINDFNCGYVLSYIDCHKLSEKKIDTLLENISPSFNPNNPLIHKYIPVSKEKKLLPIISPYSKK